MSVILVGIMLVLCFAPAGCVRAADASMSSMYRRSVDFPQGDLSRLAQVLKRAQAGDEITIGFIGGSITEGRGAARIQDCYVSQVYRWWYDTFPQATINVINAGIGGTSSYLGVHRVDEELLAHSPDLVFVEFAVNDTAEELYRNSYENLIRKILMAESNPALVLLFATNEAGDSCEAIEAELGRYYHLPMISYGKAVLPEVEAGSFAWYEIAEDIVHPNNRGHAIFAGLITNYLEGLCSRLDRIKVNEEHLQRYVLPEPLTPQRYQSAHIENAATLTPRAELGYGVYDFNYHSWITGMPWRMTPICLLRWRRAASESFIRERRREPSGCMTSTLTGYVSGRWMGILSNMKVRRRRRRSCTGHRMERLQST